MEQERKVAAEKLDGCQGKHFVPKKETALFVVGVSNPMADDLSGVDSEVAPAR